MPQTQNQLKAKMFDLQLRLREIYSLADRMTKECKQYEKGLSKLITELGGTEQQEEISV
jgi:hypothetical protein